MKIVILICVNIVYIIPKLLSHGNTWSSKIYKDIDALFKWIHFFDSE